MEYAEDSRFSQMAVRCRFIDERAVERASEVQRREKARGVSPRTIERILLEHGRLSEGKIRLIRLAGEFRAGHAGRQIAIGPYRVLGKIARGGMGSVLRAVDTRNGQLAAVKVLHRPHDSLSLRRFLREANALISLRHPNLVKGLQVGEDGDTVYFAMEYVEGETLGEMMARRGPLSDREALDIARQVARALECARKANLVHRDVKPDNILITPDRVAKLCDLGLARPVLQDSSITEVGITLGTPNYISPEQARGAADLDCRSDIYSLGVTLYHALVGEPPFDGESAGVVISRHLNEEVPPPRSRRPQISPRTDALVRRMTHRRRSARYATPRHLEYDLDAALNDVSS